MNVKDIEELEYAVNNGDLNSGYDLGRYYCGVSNDTLKWGVSFGNDAEKGIYWLEHSAKAGHVKSQRLLGIIYLNGPTILDVIGDDFPTSIFFLILGKYKKRLVFRDFNKGVKWLKRAGSNGDNESIYILGGKYVEGDCLIERHFCKRNIEEGERLLINAATESKNPYYQYELGLRYSDSRDTLRGQPADVTCFKVDYKESEKWFEYAARNEFLNDKNLPIFKLDLAKRYYYGAGVEKSYLKSKKWLEKAVESNAQHTEALYMLGLIYSEGLDLDQDAVQANELFTKVEESYLNGSRLYLLGDNFDMLHSLFSKYADGNGVPYDASKAKLWAEKYLELLEDARKNHPSYRRMKSERKSISERFRNGEGVAINIELANKLINV